MVPGVEAYKVKDPGEHLTSLIGVFFFFSKHKAGD